MSNSNLPRLELSETPNKNNDFIIFRNDFKDKKPVVKTYKVHKSITKKRLHNKKYNKKRKTKKTNKGFFNIF